MLLGLGGEKEGYACFVSVFAYNLGPIRADDLREKCE